MTIGVTEIKGLETQLQEQARSLEKMAQESAGKDRLAAEFYANISHELKTPLSVMLMDLQLMELSLNDPDAGNREALVQRLLAARLNAFRLMRLISNLTDVMKLKSGKLKARLVNTDIVAVLSGVVETAARYAGDMGIELKFESPCASRTIALDTEKLERILLNLLSNSLRHTRPGGHILVRLRDAPDFVAFSVKDDGVGMTDAIKGALFEAIKPAALFPALGIGSAGLGLPLVKGLVDVLRGRIWFESATGQGCEFFVALPVLQPDWQAPPLDTDGIPRDRRVEMEFSALIKRD
jgi:signal transduction histidine kinase